MCKRFWQGSMMLLVILLSTHPSLAVDCAPCTNLTSFLQAEVNEVATLTAQMNALQQCDPVAAALIASYIPDHQAQVNALSTLIACRGVNPGQICAQVQPCVGTREQIFQSEIQLQAQIIANYACLKANATDNATAQLATIGWYAASRHLNSLQVALAATSITPTSAMDGLLAQLALESSAIADLQSQRDRLVILGNTLEANQFCALIAQHQQQAAALQTMITQMCGNSVLVTVPPTYTLRTKDDIFCQERITETQFVNTYAMVTATLPPSALHSIASHGQAISLASLVFIEAASSTPTAVAVGPVPAAQPTTTATLTTGGG